ncbi:MAG TPA: hypothetical protein VGE63_00865 [Candidatus Paceibacterota bacterium]
MATPFNPNKISIFAKTNFRGESRPIGIKAIDRLRHMYIIGKSGVGKSTLIDNMVAQDIINGDGIALLDPHGSSAEKSIKYVPEHRIQDVVYFNPDDVNHPLAFNLIEDVHPDKRSKVANGLLSMLKKIWPDSFSARMEYLTMNMLLLLLENPGSTILGINRAFADKEFLNTLIANIKSPSLRSVWVDEILKYDEKFYREATAPIQNKVGQFISDPIIRNIVGQPKSSFDFSGIMNNQKIFIANLSKGKIDEQNARLLGGMLVTKIYLAAMGRADIAEEEQAKLPPFYLYVDEFQNFASESYADILSEARKYKLGLTMAHQYVAQLPEPVRDAVFGNVGTMVTFLTGNLDAELFEKEFSPIFTKEDFTSLGFAQIYLKLLIDGIASAPFSGQTIAPWPYPENKFVQEVLESSRTLYGRDRTVLEQEIADWFKPMPNKKDAEHERYILERRLEIEQRGGVWRDKETGQAMPKLSEEEIDAYEKKLTDILGGEVTFNREKSAVSAVPAGDPQASQQSGSATTGLSASAIAIAHHLIPKKQSVEPVISAPTTTSVQSQTVTTQTQRVTHQYVAPIAQKVEKPPQPQRPQAHEQKRENIQQNSVAPQKQHQNNYQQKPQPQVQQKPAQRDEDLVVDLPPKKERVNVSNDLKNLLSSISDDQNDDVVFSDIDTSFDVKRSFAKPKEQKMTSVHTEKEEGSHRKLQDILHEKTPEEDEGISLSDLLNKSIMHSVQNNTNKAHAREALKTDKESLSATLARLGVQKKTAEEKVENKNSDSVSMVESVAKEEPAMAEVPMSQVVREEKPASNVSHANNAKSEYYKQSEPVVGSQPVPRYVPDDLLKAMLEE